MPEKAVDPSVYGLVDAVDKASNGQMNSDMLSPRFLPLMPGKYENVGYD